VLTLLVPISAERAASLIAALDYEDMEARPARLEEIEEICTIHGVGCVGLWGLDGGDSIDVLPAEGLALVLKESRIR
jgi:predicted molibdopterin-dependent oxidoreductase YjgC